MAEPIYKTKLRLARSVEELMRTKPLAKITISDIVDHCDLTRRTFYNHFCDKYDLINWIFRNLFEETYHNISKDSSWDENILTFLTAIKNKQSFYSNAFSCDSQNCLSKYEFELLFDFYKKLIEKKHPRLLNDDMIFQLEVFCIGSVEMTAKWAREGMKRTPEELTYLFKESMPYQIKYALTQ